LRRLALIIVASTVAFGGFTHATAQPIVLSLASAASAKGQTVALELSIASDPSQAPASLQWNFTFATGDLKFLAAAVGPSAEEAGKSVTCGGGGGSYTCIAMGVNPNLIPDGVVAILLFLVSPTTASPSTAVNLTSVVGTGVGAVALVGATSGNTISIGTLVLATLSITTPVLPAPQVSTAYTQALSATGGTAPYVWSMFSGALPPGLTLSASGVISGTPTVAGTFPVVVQVTDAARTVKSVAFILTVNSAAGAPPPPPPPSTPPPPPPPPPSGLTVENAASFQAAISPNSWISILGTNLAPTTRAMVATDIVGGVLPTSLIGVGVTINGEAAPVSLVSPTQINALIPRDIVPGAATIQIVGSPAATQPITAQISALSPAFFMWPPSYVVAMRLDGSMAVKAGEFPTVTTSPANPGGILLFTGTGFGPTSPPALLGQVTPASPAYNLVSAPTITIGGIVAPYLRGGLIPGQAGMYQIEVLVPQLGSGDWPVIAKVGGVSSPTGVVLTIVK
jgi:uncharacterized protein (TIGR03437 family)